MHKKKETIVAGLDIGTTKVCAVVGKETEESALEVLGLGYHECQGLPKGVIINLEEVMNAIKRAVGEAEAQAGVAIESACVGLSGTHVKAFNSHGIVPVKSRTREIHVEDIRHAVDAARPVAVPADSQIIHVLPQGYAIDGQEGISDPLGMSGSRLEVNVHMVTASMAATQNVVSAVNRCGIMVSKLFLQPLASAEAILTPDEKELGVLLIDIGGGISDVSVFYHSSVWHTAVLPLGGDNFTRDIAVSLYTPLGEAERIKKKYGCAYLPLIPMEEFLEVPGVGGRPPRTLSRQFLCEVIQSRAEELLNFVHNEIKQAGFEKGLTAGAVLTGGGSMLRGLVDTAEQILELPVRVGYPLESIRGLNKETVNPTYATAIGLLKHGYDSKTKSHFNGASIGSNGGSLVSRFFSMTKEWWNHLMY